MNIISFDIEEYFQNEIVASPSEYTTFEKRIGLILPKVLDLLDLHDQKATFFCVGWVAQNEKEHIKEIYKRGHEIGYHTYNHEFVYRMTPKEFKTDLVKGCDIIQDLIGEKITMFRAPAFSINQKVLWAFEIMNEVGIEYDFSIFATKHSFGGFNNFPHSIPVNINVNGITIKEMPINTTSILGRKIVFSGGGYFRFFPYWLLNSLMSNSDYIMTYLHMSDFDNEVPRFNISPTRSFKSYYGRRQAFSKLKRLMDDFDFMSAGEAVKTINWFNCPTVSF